MKKIISISLLFIFSCSSKDINTTMINIFVDNAITEDISIEDTFNEVEFISTDNWECIVPGFNKITTRGESTYLSDGNNLYVMDENRKLINRINKRGRANSEYLSITDFDYHKNKFAILDRDVRKLIILDSKGKYIKHFPLDVYASTIIINSDSTVLLKNDYSSFSDNKLGRYTEININNGDISYFGEMDKTKSNYMKIMNNLGFYRSIEDKIYDFESFSPYVNRIDHNAINRHFNIRMTNTPNDNFYDIEYSDVAEFIQAFNDRGYASGISNLFYEKERLIFRYMSNQNEYYCFYDTKEEKIEHIGSLKLYNNIKINTLYFNENQIYAYVSAYRLIDAKDKDERINDLIRRFNLTIDSNPLLMKISL